MLDVTGIMTLLGRHQSWIAGKRVGLVSHAAAVDGRGRSAAQLLHDCPFCELMLLMGPEHGFFGQAKAGIACGDWLHPAWNIPVYSLYGACRAPTPAMLEACDVIVFDLQDLGVRHYTYGSTLLLTMQACRDAGVPLIVCDRPIPLPNTVDGPALDSDFSSFVGLLPVPMVYGMTPGELALFLHDTTIVDVDLRVAKMRGYRRQPLTMFDGIPWIAPSPGIVSVQSAMTYPALVFSEAFRDMNHGAGTAFSFQSLTHSEWDAEGLAGKLNTAGLHGVLASPFWTCTAVGKAAPSLQGGVRVQVTQPDRFRPIALSVVLLELLQSIRSVRSFWHPRLANGEFFDRLYGTDRVRQQLRAGVPAKTIIRDFETSNRRFRKTRQHYLLYRP